MLILRQKIFINLYPAFENSKTRIAINLQLTLFCDTLFNKKSMWFLSQHWIIITISNDSIAWVLPAKLIQFNVVKLPLLRYLNYLKWFFITMLNNNHDFKNNSLVWDLLVMLIQCVKTQNSGEDTMVIIFGQNLKFRIFFSDL